MIQIDGVYTTFCQQEGIRLQKYRDRNGRCIAILFKNIGVRGRCDSPDFQLSFFQTDLINSDVHVPLAQGTCHWLRANHGPIYDRTMKETTQKLNALLVCSLTFPCISPVMISCAFFIFLYLWPRPLLLMTWSRSPQWGNFGEDLQLSLPPSPPQMTEAYR